MADNADNCNTCYKSLVRSLRPDEPETSRRGRCFGYIVNLAVKAFIYGKDAKGFITKAEQIITLTARDLSAVQREIIL